MNAGDEMVRGLGDVLDEHCLVACTGHHLKCACGARFEAGKRLHHAHLANILAAHVLGLVAAGKAEALREAADAWTQGAWSNVMLPKPTPPAVPVIAYSNRVGDWLRDRADGLAGEAS